MSRLLRILILVFVSSAATTSVIAKPLPRSVLIVSQWDPGLPFFADFDIAFDARLHAAAKEPVSVYAEAMDLSRFSEPKYQDNFRRYLEEKYRDKNVGVIVAVGPLALELILSVRLEFFPTAPVVFSVVDEATISKLKMPTDVTGTTMHLTLHDMVRMGHVLVPKLQGVALVGERLGGTSVYRSFKNELAQLAGLEFIDLTGLPLAEVEKRVAALPENTAILYTAIFVDGAGIAYDPTVALEAIAKMANRPIVNNTDTQLGTGAVGGLLFMPKQFGQAHRLPHSHGSHKPPEFCRAPQGSQTAPRG